MQRGIDNNLSGEEAQKQAGIQWLTGILGDAIGGFLSGGIMGGGKGVVDVVIQTAQNAAQKAAEPGAVTVPGERQSATEAKQGGEERQPAPVITAGNENSDVENPISEDAEQPFTDQAEPGIVDTQNQEGVQRNGEAGRTESGDRGYERRNRLAADQSGRGVQAQRRAEEGYRQQKQRAESVRHTVEAQGITPQSAKQLGFKDGTDNATARKLTDDLLDRSQRKAKRRMQKDYGVTLDFITGDMEMYDNPDKPISEDLVIRDPNRGTFRARAAISEDGKHIVVRVDHDFESWEKLLGHEEFHANVKADKSVFTRAKDAFVREYGEDERAAIVRDYVKAYQFAGVSDDYILEEVLADYYAGIEGLYGTQGGQTDVAERGEIVRGVVAEKGASAAVTSGGESRASRNANREKFRPHKFYDSIVRRMEQQNPTGYTQVGSVENNGFYHQLGLPAGNVYFDNSKILKELNKPGDPLPVEYLREVPNILNSPTVITQAEEANTISVFGDVWRHGEPVLVGVMVVKDRSGRNVINKIRTVHTRSDAGKLISDESTLYLNEDKKRTEAWFQASRIKMPLGGTKFGLIRKIALTDDIVKAVGDVKASRDLTPQDKTYLAAVESGDMEKAQEMVDEAAKAAGYTFFRRTRKSGRAYNDVPWMMFTDADEKIEGNYGDNRYTANAKDATDVYDIEDDIKELLKSELDMDVESDEVNPPDIVMSAGVWDNEEAVMSIYENILAPRDILAVLTNDGMIAFEQGNIVKSLDPVTYDDQGNVIPLSRRFDPEENDIRHSRELAIAAPQGGESIGKKPSGNVSKVRSNTFEFSGFMNDMEKRMEGLRMEDSTYEPIPEPESMAGALARLEDDWEFEAEELEKQDAWGSEDLDTAMGILHHYRQLARLDGNYRNVIKWAKLIVTKGTKAGQMIQAFAKAARFNDNDSISQKEAKKVMRNMGGLTTQQKAALFRCMCPPASKNPYSAKIGKEIYEEGRTEEQKERDAEKKPARVITARG